MVMAETQPKPDSVGSNSSRRRWADPRLKNMQINQSRNTESLGSWKSVASMRFARLKARVDRLPITRTLSPKKAHILELTLVVAAYLVYVFTRGLIFSDSGSAGLENAGRIISLEKSLGFFWEPDWQSWVLSNVKGFAALLNWTYIFTYWPIIVAAGTALYVVNRPRYYYYRSVVVINLVFALTIFMLFPVTSPFNITEYFVNTIQVLGPSFYAGPEMASFYNAQAAMPSLHFSWTVILGVLFVRTFKGWFRIIGVLYPVITFLAITITGNHFILDAIAGGILAVVSFALMELSFHGGFSRVWRKTIYLLESLRRKETQYRQESLRLGEKLLARNQRRRISYGLVSPRIRLKGLQGFSSQKAVYRDIWLRFRSRLPMG